MADYGDPANKSKTISGPGLVTQLNAIESPTRLYSHSQSIEFSARVRQEHSPIRRPQPKRNWPETSRTVIAFVLIAIAFIAFALFAPAFVL